MNISNEKLNKLTGWKYEEYKTLSKIDFEGKKYKDFTSFLFQCVLCLLVGSVYISIRNEDVSNWLKIFGFTFLIGIIFPLSWVPTILISDEFYTKIYSHFSHKTKGFLRFQELKTHFEHIERQVEEEAILILSKVEVEALKRIKENRRINYNIRLKRKWQSWYARDLETVQNNCELNNKLLKIVDKNLEYIKYDTVKRHHFKRFQDELKNSFSYYTWLEWKVNSLYGRTSSSVQPSPSTNGKNSKSTSNFSYTQIKEESKSRKKSPNKTDEPIKQKININQSESEVTPNEILGRTFKQNGEITIAKENKIIELPESSLSITQPEENQLKFDFDNPKITLKTTNDIPTKRTTPKYEPIIKASPQFYQKLAIKKLEIGMKGELLVMEHERQRLLEGGENPDAMLRHKSVSDGDGFGYDILSFENGKEIYIEVKTTTGSFWSNLFFTQNEYEKMNEFEEQYYLYRICNLDLETNKGDLFIFAGKEMIDLFFDFKSKMYVLTQKAI